MHHPSDNPLDPALETRLLAAVEAGFDEQLAFTQALVRIPSQMRDEEAAQQMMAAAYQARGYQVDQWQLKVEDLCDQPGYSPVADQLDLCSNVVATHQPRSNAEQQAGRSLILNGHIDVVPVGPLAQWSRDPYDPHIKEGWLYGRGSGDMKAGLVANLFALDALKRIGYQPAAPVYLQSVVEEECTGNGTLACLVKGYQADAAIIPEPVGDALVRAATGLIWFRVEVLGKPAVMAETAQSVSAIDSLQGVIAALKGLEAQWNDQRHQQPHYRDTERSINLNIGRISGGDWPSSVPAWASMDCRINLFPDRDPAAAFAEIQACIANYANTQPGLIDQPPKVSLTGHFSGGYELQPNTDAEQLLASVHHQVFASELPTNPITAYVDAAVFAIYGDMPCLVYGPKAENIHSFDERVNLESLLRVTKTIALFTARWCGLEKN